MSLWRCSPSQGKDPSGLLHTHFVLSPGSKWPASQGPRKDSAFHTAASQTLGAQEPKKGTKSCMTVLRGEAWPPIRVRADSGLHEHSGLWASLEREGSSRDLE